MESPLLQYRKDRAAEYPEIAEQLDMIFHELKTIGSLSPPATDDSENGFVGWATIIQGIKDRHPIPVELDQESEA